MAKKRKFVKWVILGLVIGALLLIVSLAHLYINVVPEKQLEREFARMRAQGEAVTLEEAAPPEIPDAENAAVIYEQAFAFYYRPGRDEEIKLGEIVAKDLTTWTEEDITAIREYLKKNEDCLPLIFEAASFKKCRFGIDYSVAPWDIRLRHLSKMRNCGRLLARDALLKAKEGKINEALESTRSGLRLGRGSLDEPILVSQLVRFAIDSLMFTTLQKILDGNDAESEILLRLLEELNIEESRAGFIRCIQGERCFQIQLFEAVIKDPALLAQMGQPGGGPHSFVSMKGYKIMGPFARPIFKRDEIFALSIMRRMIEAARLPYHQAKSDLAKIDRDIDKAPLYRIISKMLLPAFTRPHLNEARHETRIGLAQLALALKIYKAEKGKYPDFLTELVPEILPELPKDPFTGKDFVYKCEGEGFLVYSLGENATDEGGLEPNDIPWRCKR